MSIKERLEDWAIDYVPGPIYRIPFRIKDFLKSIKYLLQRIFRKSHASDLQLWNLGYDIIKYTYPKLKAFVEMDKSGYPIDFEEYNSEHWKSKEEYNKSLEAGDHTGGGKEKWNEILNEMLFAFEFKYLEDSAKDDGFYKRWNIENPYEEKEENLRFSYQYNLENGRMISTSEPLSDEEIKKRGATLNNLRKYHLNYELLNEHEKRAQRGFELFGKYLTTMWD